MKRLEYFPLGSTGEIEASFSYGILGIQKILN